MPKSITGESQEAGPSGVAAATVTPLQQRNHSGDGGSSGGKASSYDDDGLSSKHHSSENLCTDSPFRVSNYTFLLLNKSIRPVIADPCSRFDGTDRGCEGRARKEVGYRGAATSENFLTKQNCGQDCPFNTHFWVSNIWSNRLFMVRA